jgi:hypothetical protein
LALRIAALELVSSQVRQQNIVGRDVLRVILKYCSF